MRGFVSYSHEDHRLFARLRPYLGEMRRLLPLELWTDHEITTGSDWDARIASAIGAAEVFVLFISPDFIDSAYVHGTELPAIKQRRQEGALVLPVVARRCSWQYVASGLQAAPTENGRVRPIMECRPRDHGFDCAREQMTAAIESHFGVKRSHFDWGKP